MGNRNVSKNDRLRLSADMELRLKALLNGDLDVPVGHEDGKQPIVEQLFDTSDDEVQEMSDKDIFKLLREQRLEATGHNVNFLIGLASEQEKKEAGKDNAKLLDFGVQRYLKQMLGADLHRKVPAVLKRLNKEFSIWLKEPEMEDGLPASYQTWRETKAHGENPSSHELEDMSDSDCESNRCMIPYARDEHGEVVMVGEYKKMQIFLARQLPAPKGQPLVYLQDKLQELIANKQWPAFHRLLGMLRQYQEAMKDAKVETGHNGLRAVYYLRFGQVVVFSPITYNELAPAEKGKVDARFAAKKAAEAFKAAIETSNGPEDFAKAKAMYKAMIESIRQAEAWWLWKEYVKPYQGLMADELTADDLGLA